MCIYCFICFCLYSDTQASCGNKWMNDDVVRKHWNFSGVIETDCGAMSNPNLCGKGGCAATGNGPLHQAEAVRCLAPILDETP